MKDLTKGNPSILILTFALPIFLGNLLQLTYSLVDTRIVGSFLGEDALAAVVAHYQNYIRALATRPLKDEYGNTYLYVDEDMRLRLETKLIHSIVTGFKVQPV